MRDPVPTDVSPLFFNYSSCKPKLVDIGWTLLFTANDLSVQPSLTNLAASGTPLVKLFGVDFVSAFVWELRGENTCDVSNLSVNFS